MGTRKKIIGINQRDIKMNNITRRGLAFIAAFSVTYQGVDLLLMWNDILPVDYLLLFFGGVTLIIALFIWHHALKLRGPLLCSAKMNNSALE